MGLEGISGPEKNIANEKILNYCPGILDIVNNKSLNHLLEKYLGKNFKILNIYPTISKPIKADANDQEILIKMKVYAAIIMIKLENN